MTDRAGSLLRTLERLGLRETRARRQVVEAVVRLRDGFTVEELHASLPRVGRATVYRTVKLMVEAGLVCKTALENGEPRYRLGPHSHHHHLVCESCGAVRDFARCDVEGTVEHLERSTGFVVLSHRVELFGICPDCRNVV